MRRRNFAIIAGICFVDGVTPGQTPPPTTFTIQCETNQLGFQASLPVQNHPFWALVTNARSEYWVVNTVPTQFGRSGWVHGTVLAMFDDLGHVLAQNEHYNGQATSSALAFGTVWNSTFAGSPTMLSIGRNYYLGVAGAGSTFSDGFNCAMSTDQGIFAGAASPAPGSVTGLGLAGCLLLRRRR